MAIQPGDRVFNRTTRTSGIARSEANNGLIEVQEQNGQVVHWPINDTLADVPSADNPNQPGRGTMSDAVG